VRSLLDAPAPAVLTTYRKGGSAHTVPVWYRWTGEAFEVVIAKGDVKLRHLARNPRCVLVVFEAVRPFRGVEVRGVAELVEGDVTSARVAIAGRYLGLEDGERFAADRRSRPGCSCGSSPTVRGCGICRGSCLPDRPWTGSTYRPCVLLGAGPTGSCLPWHPIFCRMRLDHREPLGLPCLPWHRFGRMALDHPFDHPDEPSGAVWSRLDRRASQREQARSVWSRPGRRLASVS
jgi:PPOX class probable F420-dependent enzyme